MTSLGNLFLAMVMWTAIAAIVFSGILLTTCAVITWRDWYQDRHAEQRIATLEARRLGEIAELEMSWHLPNAPSSPRWTQ